jgi:hypothetical protein
MTGVSSQIKNDDGSVSEVVAIQNDNGLINSNNPLPIMSQGIKGGALTYFNAALTNTVVAVKNTAGTITMFEARNPNPTEVFVQLFDLPTGSVTLGTTLPKIAFWVAGFGSKSIVMPDDAKIAFSNAISIAATTSVAGNAAPASPILIQTINYY